jgi:hypothetical protein
MVSGAEWRLRQFAGLKVRRQTAELLENNRLFAACKNNRLHIARKLPASRFFIIYPSSLHAWRILAASVQDYK